MDNIMVDATARSIVAYRSGGEKNITIRLNLGVRDHEQQHITLFYAKDCPARQLAEFWEMLRKQKFTGNFNCTEFKTFGSKKVIVGKFDESAELHKNLWVAAYNQKTVQSEMPDAEFLRVRDNYYYTAHISMPNGYIEKKEDLISIPLKGCKIEMKLVGPQDPFLSFTL